MLDKCLDINSTELNKLLQEQSDLKIVDVRTPMEFVNAHIPGALSRPLGELEKWASEFNKGQAMVLVCASGGRSKIAANALMNLGFFSLFNLKGGMGSWNGPVK